MQLDCMSIFTSLRFTLNKLLSVIIQTTRRIVSKGAKNILLAVT